MTTTGGDVAMGALNYGSVKNDNDNNDCIDGNEFDAVSSINNDNDDNNRDDGHDDDESAELAVRNTKHKNVRME
jgi:hypothetical protein